MSAASFVPRQDIALGRRLTVAVRRGPRTDPMLRRPIIAGDVRLRPDAVRHPRPVPGAAVALRPLPPTRGLFSSAKGDTRPGTL